LEFEKYNELAMGEQHDYKALKELPEIDGREYEERLAKERMNKKRIEQEERENEPNSMNIQ